MGRQISKIFFLVIFFAFLFTQGSMTNILIIPINAQSYLVKEKQVMTEKPFEFKDVSKSLKIDLEFGKMPLYFISNKGQVDENVLFYAKASRYTLWLIDDGLVFDGMRRIEEKRRESHHIGQRDRFGRSNLDHDRDVSRMTFISVNKDLEVVPRGETNHTVNYFIGSDESKWRSGVPTSEAIVYKELYSNIDLEVYGMENKVEYDWMVKPGGKVEEIAFCFRDVNKTRIDFDGNLEIETYLGRIIHKKPTGYQEIRGEKIAVEVDFKELGEKKYGFEAGNYCKSHDLVIDPVILMYSTYLGGTGSDEGRGVALDNDGSLYVTGYTGSTNFPTDNEYMSDSDGSLYDVFVTKLSTSGSSLVYSTYLGGTGNDEGYGIAVDGDENAYVTGYTGSTNFPTKGAYMYDPDGSLYDVFVTKLSTSGSSLVYSTYLGGTGNDEGYGIAVDGDENAYVTGYTGSTNFPTKSAYMYDPDGSLYDAFVTKLSTSGSSLAYSTYLGGTGSDEGYGIAVDGDENAYVTGYTGSTNFPTKAAYMHDPDGSLNDAFVTKLSTLGSGLVFSTYLGGTGNDGGYGIAVDGDESAYVTGYTGSTNFPTDNEYMSDPDGSLNDAFVTKLSGSGNSLEYSTYLGGSGSDEGHGIAVDSAEYAYITGYTMSTNFPEMNEYMSDPDGSLTDVFVTKLSATGSSLMYSTYLGGTGNDEGCGIVVDTVRCAYVTGFTGSINFPTENEYMDDPDGSLHDAFVTKLSSGDALPEIIITNPSDGSTVSGGVAVQVSASDDNGIVKVDFFVDDLLEKTDSVSPYDHDWDTTAVNNGDHTLRAVAYDTIDQTGSDEITVTVNNVSTWSLTIASQAGGTTSPAPGTHVYSSGTVVEVLAIQSAGYGFLNWNGDVPSGHETDNPVFITMDGNKSITANFKTIDWKVIKRLTWNPGDSVQPCLVVDKSGCIHVVWQDDSPGNDEVFYRKSIDEGMTWISKKRLTWNSGVSRNPALAADTSGHIHLVWDDDTPGRQELFYKKSTNGGATWSPTKRLTRMKRHSRIPAIVIDQSDNIHIVWVDLTPGNHEIFHMRSLDGETTWSTPKRMTWNPSLSNYPSIAAGSGNALHVAWQDDAAGNEEIYYKKSTNGGVSWQPAKRLTWNSGASRYPNIAIDTGNDIHVVWTDISPGNYEVFYKKSTNGGSSWPMTRRLTWNGGLSMTPVMTPDTGDNIYVVWNDKTTGNYEIHYKRTTDAGSSWTSKRLTWNGGDSVMPCIAPASINEIHLVWTDDTPGNNEIYCKTGIK